MLLHTFTALSCPSRQQCCAAGQSAAPLTLLRDFVAILTLIEAAEGLEKGCYSCLSLSRFHRIRAGESFPLRHNMIYNKYISLVGGVTSWSETLFTNRKVQKLCLVYIQKHCRNEFVRYMISDFHRWNLIIKAHFYCRSHVQE